MKDGIAILLSKGKPKMDMSKDMPMDKAMPSEDSGGKIASMKALKAAMDDGDFAGMSKALEDHYAQCEGE